MKSINLMLSLAAGASLLAIAACTPREDTMKTEVGNAEAPLISRQVLFGNPTYANVQISPDGSMISWVAPLDGVMNIFVAPADELGAAKAVTSDTGRGIRSYGWAAGMNRLIYIQDRGGDENFLLYGVDPETGEETDYTPFENTRVQFLASDEDHPGKLIIGLNNRDARWHDAYALDLVSGALTLVYENTDQIGDYVFDNDLNMRFGAKSTPEGGSVYYKYDGGAWTEFLAVSPEDLYTTGLSGFNEANSVLYLTDSRTRDTGALFAYDMASGTSTLIAADDRADIGGTWDDKVTGEPMVYAVTYDTTELKALTPQGEIILNALKAQFTGEISVASRSDDDTKWVLVNVQSDSVPTYWIWDRAANSFAKLFAVRPELEGATLAKMQPVIIRSRDGLNLVSYLTLPKGSDADGDGMPDKPLPMVLNVHGGPWARDFYGFDGEAQWLANRGYAVLQVNFRGSTGFGKNFVNAGNLEWGLKMHDDLLDAVEWAVSKGVTTTDQVAIYGGSYGGYATLAGLTFTPETFACGVDIVGPSNLETLLDSVPPYWESFRRVLETRVGDPNTPEGLAILKAASPLNSVDKISRPLLIAQGANDPRVKQAESDQIVSAMEARSIPVTYALFPDEGHGFARPENRLAFYGVAEGFLSACLGGRTEPLGDDLAGSSLTVPVGAAYVDGLAGALEGFTPEERG